MSEIGVLRGATSEFRRLRDQAESALAQVTDEDWDRAIDGESNSIALLVKHLAGNMRSRWTDFLTSDGEKPDRDRDSEFVRLASDTPESLRRRWEAGWQCLFDALDPLDDGDLARIVTIRGEPHTVLQAVHRQVSHYAYHVGQIVQLARHYAGDRWQTLSVARGQSVAFNRDPSSYLDSEDSNGR